jgi:hypothetical protein
MTTTRHYLRAYELARILLEYPNMKVGIKTTGKFKHSPINSVEVKEWDADDNGCLITSEEGGKWLLLNSIKRR